jgi:hypothetical protein
MLTRLFRVRVLVVSALSGIAPDRQLRQQHSLTESAQVPHHVVAFKARTGILSLSRFDPCSEAKSLRFEVPSGMAPGAEIDPFS